MKFSKYSAPEDNTMFEFSPVTDREIRLRERYRGAFPKVSTERVKMVMEFYKEHVADTIILKRAKLLDELCEKLTVLVE